LQATSAPASSPSVASVRAALQTVAVEPLPSSSMSVVGGEADMVGRCHVTGGVRTLDAQSSKSV